MSEPVIVFDGECVACSRWVRFVLRHDREGRFRFASMQGRTGHRYLVAAGFDPRDPISMLLVEGDAVRSDSDAIVRIVDSFGGPWRLVRVAKIVPRAVRDAAYRWLARNRYRLFGRLDRCLVPDAGVAKRFLP